MSDDIDRSDELLDWYAEGDADPDVTHSAHLGMAVKLAEQFDGKLLYVEKVGWHRWDGARWAPGAASYARRAVHTVIKRRSRRGRKAGHIGKGTRETAPADRAFRDRQRHHRHSHRSGCAATVLGRRERP